MQVQWTLVVEGLGRIERAEVRLHPFMLFVGENNSGKSYLASLLWGLASLGPRIFPDDPPTSAAFESCDHWLLQRFEKCGEEPDYTLSEEDHQIFLKWWNDILSTNKDYIVSSIFNVPEMKVSRLEIRDLRRHAPFQLRLSTLAPQSDTSLAFSHGLDHLSVEIKPLEQPSRDLRYTLLQTLVWRVLMDGISQLNPRLLTPADRIGKPLYLPASRTGFMLLHKAVVRRQIGQLLEAESTGEILKLTRPAIRFLELIAVEMKGSEGTYREEADFLERESLPGRLEFSTGVGGNEFRYHPGGASPVLPMALSSSLVTELAPIILALRHLEKLPVLILEEPEAHLHPKIQRLLAQILVRLVRKGVKVWVTTHSENFCQQVANFTKLGQLSNRTEVARELGYGEQDYLELAEVAGYQFVSRGDASVVSELEKSPAGLTMPTFNDELLKLAQQTLFLQRAATKSTDEA